ncbi:MAG: hypothetical protein KDC07_07375 [Chitinophagaceae bacterium]|nr:hypothetical protein [Chitinophagaceae bacterium]MCB9047254.1 hypothetical protein [Chitinophagales bacterium]
MRISLAILSIGLSVVLCNHAMAQDKKSKEHLVQKAEGDDLMALLEDDQPAKKSYTTATFKTTRLVTGQSIENTGKGVLDFRVNHRFGSLNNGVSTFFGLDDANTRIGFDYGVTDWLMVGFGRNSYMKEYDGFFKAKIMRQTENKGNPVSISYVGAMSAQSLPAPTLPAGQDYHFSNRLYYVNQLLIARKFNQWLSLQLTPTHIHYNLVPTTPESNDLVAIGFGGRVKVSNRVTINGEYYYRVPGTEQLGYHNVLSLGVDIETGGHVFQLMLSNSRTMTERAMIGQTQGTWGFGKADAIHLGFNISRVFTIVKPKEFKN